MHDLNQIIAEIVPQAFPELAGKKIELEYVRLDDASFDCVSYREHYWIRVDKDMASAPRRVLVGGLAHELCHFILNKKETVWQALKYKLSKSYRIIVERNTDLETIKRGFGPQLLALARYNETQNDGYDAESGLSAAELENLLFRN